MIICANGAKIVTIGFIGCFITKLLFHKGVTMMQTGFFDCQTRFEQLDDGGDPADTRIFSP